MTIIINFLGGPGVGKSTAAASLFAYLKQRDVNVELIQEFCKELVYTEDKSLENQIFVFGNQFHRQWRLMNRVDYIITDSPLVLSSIYFEAHYRNNPEFSLDYRDISVKYFDTVFQEFDNLNILIERNTVFQETGRVHSLEESEELDLKIKKKLDFLGEKYYTANSGNAVDTALDWLNIQLH